VLGVVVAVPIHIPTTTLYNSHPSSYLSILHKIANAARIPTYTHIYESVLDIAPNEVA
jgi:hypothetical protein